MNKLIITAMVACATTFAQAASIDWQFQEQALDKNNPVDISSYTAYLFTSTTWTDAMAGGITAETFNSAVDKTTSAFTKTTGGSGANTFTKWASGLQTWTNDAAASGDYYVVIFDGNQYAASELLGATAYSSSQEAHTSASWTIAANKPALTTESFTSIPEPTSGLLLLLGMAGLALKRKQA